MKRIDISMVNNVQALRRSSEFCGVKKSTINEDEFLKTDNAKVVLNSINDFFGRLKFSKFVRNLIDTQYWTDGVNYVGFGYKDNAISKVGVGIFEPKKSEVVRHVISTDDFSDLMTKVTAFNINKSPENELEYKKLYLELVDYLEHNRVKK